MRRIAAVHNNLTRQPIIQQAAIGKNPAGTPAALNAAAIRNPQSRVFNAQANNINAVKKIAPSNINKTP